MSYNSGLIQDPVSVYDVRQAIGSSSTDVGTLCKSDSVNKWAKYKPIKFATIGILTTQNITSKNYGIVDIPVWSRLDYMADFLFADNRATNQTWWPTCDISKGSLSLEYWAHEKPTGNSSSPYRLADFDNYYHLAEAPVGNMSPTSIEISPSALLTIRFPLGASNTNALKLSDFALPDAGDRAVSGMYFGVVLKQKVGTMTAGKYAITQTTTVASLSGDNASVQIQLTASDTAWAGTWNIYPIISQVAIASLTSSLSTYTNYFTCPLPFHGQDITISIKKAKFTINITSAYRNSDGQHVTVELSLTNTDESPRNYRVQFTVYDSSDNVLATQDITSATAVSGGATANREVNITIPNGNWSNAYRLYALCTVTDSVVVFKESTDAYSQIGNEPPTPSIT